jgi:hypothetical protein
MKEVTPDNDVLKSSVFHRLIQRAFPEWFPYDSIRFFHPFYTAEQNAKLAHQQGYAGGFSMTVEPSAKNWFGKPTAYTYDTSKSNPSKPMKPLLLKDWPTIKALLEDRSDNLIHPARLPSALKDMPTNIADVLKQGRATSKVIQAGDVDVDRKVLMEYFTGLIRDITKREVIVMDEHIPVYQIDVTRE